MSCHPGHDLDGLINSLERALETYWRCHVDLMTRLDEFDTASQDGTLFGKPRRAELRAHERACRKEIFALSCAAAALVEMARHVVKNIIVPKIDQLRTQLFDEGQHEFVKALRNHLDHATFLNANWSIEKDRTGQTSHFEFRRAELLRGETFNTKAQKYINGWQDRIDVRNLFETYSKSVQLFYAWLIPEIEIQLPADVQDYRRCIRARRANSARSWYRIIFSQVVQPTTDVYSHLPDYLTADELGEINSLPHRSKQQVDRIIDIVDEYGACDHELRELVYKAFGLNG
jgi:hypothetical protein